MQEKKRVNLPILTAKVTNQFQIDTDNNEKISFEVITKQNGKIVTSTKRNYSNFRSLDDVLTNKYNRQIMRGQMSKRELPAGGNLTSI